VKKYAVSFLSFQRSAAGLTPLTMHLQEGVPVAMELVAAIKRNQVYAYV
jgi:hypothetical protein